MTAQTILAISQTCVDLEAQASWYCNNLGFRLDHSDEFSGSWLEALFGCKGLLALQRSVLRLGDEALQLWAWKHSLTDAAPGSYHSCAIPSDSNGTDLWFQHICIVSSNIATAYAKVEAAGCEPISSSIQCLPSWNIGAAGIQAVKFKDQLGHALELLQFPADKGATRWHRQTSGEGVLLGLDHSAIGISDTDQSLHFYVELLGFSLSGGGLNYGLEQDKLDGLSSAKVKITSVRPDDQKLGLEFLHYLQPSGGRQRVRALPTDICEWRIILQVDNLQHHHKAIQDSIWSEHCGSITELDPELFGQPRAFFARDPDGHAVVVVGS